MPLDQRWPQEAEARFYRSSNEEMPRSNENENEHEESEEETAKNLLAREFH